MGWPLGRGAQQGRGSLFKVAFVFSTEKGWAEGILLFSPAARATRSVRPRPMPGVCCLLAQLRRDVPDGASGPTLGRCFQGVVQNNQSSPAESVVASNTQLVCGFQQGRPPVAALSSTSRRHRAKQPQRSGAAKGLGAGGAGRRARKQTKSPNLFSVEKAGRTSN